jgi:hypothetical protein
VNNSETLYVPIQINGFTGLANEVDATQLYPRELYITSEGRLIIGNPKVDKQKELTSTLGVTVDTALVAKKVNYESPNKLSKINTDETKIKGFMLEDADVRSGSICGASVGYGSSGSLLMNLNGGSIVGGTIQTSNLNGVTKLNLDSKTCWGTELPTNASVGDVFILV